VTQKASRVTSQAARQQHVPGGHAREQGCGRSDTNIRQQAARPLQVYRKCWQCPFVSQAVPAAAQMVVTPCAQSVAAHLLRPQFCVVFPSCSPGRQRERHVGHGPHDEAGDDAAGRRRRHQVLPHLLLQSHPHTQVRRHMMAEMFWHLAARLVRHRTPRLIAQLKHHGQAPQRSCWHAMAVPGRGSSGAHHTCEVPRVKKPAVKALVWPLRQAVG
jgi:hypothetical protein